MDNFLLDRNYQGFAEGNQEMMESLFKALEAGSGVDAAAFTGGRAMIPESLDTTLVNVLWKQDEAKLFKALKKQPVKSPVHQWTRKTGVGDDDGAWVAEGGESEEKDTELERVNVTMKYLQTLRKATLQATISNMLEDAITTEKQSGTLWIIKQVEKILFHGDSTMVTEEPDGIEKLLKAKITSDPENIIDMRGKDATSSDFEDKMEEASRVIRQKYGLATDLYASLKTIQDVQKLLRDRIRFGAEKAGTGMTLGSMIFETYPTIYGKIKLIDDLFLLEGEAPRSSSITTKRPSQVTFTTGSGAHGDSEFVADDAGTYYYKVAAVNKYGQALVSPAVSLAVAEGERAVLSVTEGSTIGTCFFIFRSKKNAADGTNVKFALKVVRTGTDPDIYDYNADLPGTSKAFVLNLDAMYDAIGWLQFLPMMKFNLFPTNAAIYPFLMLLFGSLGMKKTEQAVMIKNISPSDLNWF